MKIVFISNYYNHHQSSFSEIMNMITNGNYCFIETERMADERIEMGWREAPKPSFLYTSYTSEGDYNACIDMINSADVVMVGSAPFKMVSNRLSMGKLVFFYSERWYKSGYDWWKFPVRALRQFINYGCYKNTYMLCASAFTAADCSKTLAFLNKTFKWGYFTELRSYNDLKDLIKRKCENSILWAGRLIDLKHPEVLLRLAKRLKQCGFIFSINIIGDGPLRAELEEQINGSNLTDCIRLIGSMSPEEVRNHMEASQIYLCTSDFNEGWGAVVNEAMNSACAVVASHAIGSVPFLIEDGKNGLIYENGNEDQLYEIVSNLLEHPNECERLGEQAYNTIANCWNAEIAAKRFLKLADTIISGEKNPDIYEEGPCSKDAILKNNWYTR